MQEELYGENRQNGIGQPVESNDGNAVVEKFPINEDKREGTHFHAACQADAEDVVREASWRLASCWPSFSL